MYGRLSKRIVHSQFVNALISQQLTVFTLWNLPCTSDRVVRKLEIVVQLHRLREGEVVNCESDLSKTDKLRQSLQLPHTPSPHCHARIFGLSRRALALPWG